MNTSKLQYQSNCWKHQQAFSEFIGFGAFFLASLVVFPNIGRNVDFRLIFAWFLRIGAASLSYSNWMLCRHYGFRTLKG